MLSDALWTAVIFGCVYLFFLIITIVVPPVLNLIVNIVGNLSA